MTAKSNAKVAEKDTKTSVVFPAIIPNEDWFADGKLGKWGRRDFVEGVEGAQEYAAYRMYQWLLYYQQAPTKADPAARKLRQKRQQLERAQAKLQAIQAEIEALASA